MNKSDEIRAILDENSLYRDILFSRGYLLTDSLEVLHDNYPFYGLWAQGQIKGYTFYVHPQQTYYVFEDDAVSLLLIGHAYNPFCMEYDEHKLLEQCAYAYTSNNESVFEIINDWTGIFALFIFHDGLKIVQDCAGIKSVYYGIVKETVYIASHAQLIADICTLQMDPFIRQLISNRMYKVGNRYLPGDMSPFIEVKHLSANLYLQVSSDKSCSKHRFYPTHNHGTITTESDYIERVKSIYQILHNNIELASKKWKNCYISLSGGMDSKTTLSCANGLYDRLKYFSFTSKDTELVDAKAAHDMCEKIGLTHEVIPIPMSNDEVENFGILHKIIDHNDAYVRFLKDSEIRKQITLYYSQKIGVELKSWISETVRVFMERKYGLRFPPVLSPRHFTIFQTRLFGNPELLHKCDMIYANYIKSIDLEKPLFDFEHTDLYYWEFRMSSWGMMVITSLDMCHTVTFPWNNRRLIEMFLTLPRSDRKADDVHRKIIRYGNPDLLFDENVENKYFTSYRIWIEKLYYYYRTAFIKRK